MPIAGGGVSESEASLHPGEGVGYAPASRTRLRAESCFGEVRLFRQRRRLSSKANFQRSRALSSADFCKGDSGRRIATSPISTFLSASLLFLGDLSTAAIPRAGDGRGTGAGLIRRA